MHIDHDIIARWRGTILCFVKAQGTSKQHNCFGSKDWNFIVILNISMTTYSYLVFTEHGEVRERYSRLTIF